MQKVPCRDMREEEKNMDDTKLYEELAKHLDQGVLGIRRGWYHFLGFIEI